MLQLIYASGATKPFTAESLRTLLVAARTNNTGAGVSGMLLHVDGAFLQVLEGEAAVVEALYTRIGKDPRHARVVRLLAREVPERNFADWSMGFFDASGRATEIAGYRPTAGFSDLIGDPKQLLRIVDQFRDGRWRSLAA
ncbi:MAG: BLUF domain-containing protein [Kofleriaceae bacterium]